MARTPVLHNGYSRKQILHILKNSEYARIRALLMLYSFYQTSDEQEQKQSIYLNGVGFTGAHAPYLSDLALYLQNQWGLDINMPKAEFLAKYREIKNNKKAGKCKLGILSDRQLGYVKKLIPQYYEQIWNSMA